VEHGPEGLEAVPYRFTGKELDEETGLYYYGARYLNPRTSRWVSADPGLETYLPLAPVDEEAIKRNQDLPGEGGVFNIVNLALYHYSANNPLANYDPTGFDTSKITVNIELGFIVGGSISIGILGDNSGSIGNFAVVSGYSYGVHPLPEVSLSIFHEKTKAKTVYDLGGGADRFSVSYGEILMFTMAETDYRNKIKSKSYGLGLGVGSPFSSASEVESTGVFGISFETIFKDAGTLFKNIGKLLKGEKGLKQILEGIKNPFGYSGAKNIKGEGNIRWGAAATTGDNDWND
jgi:RHS repeat-associated protein